MLDVKDLVSRETGLVSRQIFVDQEVYEMELERIFARSWLFLAHETQLPNPGDFVAAYMGEDPVLVVRDSRGKINAFLNTCRHRGMRVCRADAGNAAAFTCTYHGWTYGNDGKLVGVPGYKEYYYEELDMEQWGLVPVAQVDSYAGMIFGTFDSSAPPLLEYLGDMAYYLDFLVHRRPEGSEVVGGVNKWIMPCNWKFAADNFAGDGYHVPITHISATKMGFTSNRISVQQRTRGLHVSPQGGHGVITRPGFNPDATWPVDEWPQINEYYHQTLVGEMEQHLGPRTHLIEPIVGTCFPNLSFEFFTMRVWHPRGPQKTEVWSWCFVDKAAPEHLKREMQLFHSRRFGPGGAFEQDDGENWNQCTYASNGRISRRQEFNYSMGLGHERYDENVPGLTCESPSEVRQRNLYSRWAELMAAESWDDIRTSGSAGR